MICLGAGTCFVAELNASLWWVVLASIFSGKAWRNTVKMLKICVGEELCRPDLLGQSEQADGRLAVLLKHDNRQRKQCIEIRATVKILLQASGRPSGVWNCVALRLSLCTASNRSKDSRVPCGNDLAFEHRCKFSEGRVSLGILGSLNRYLQSLCVVYFRFWPTYVNGISAGKLILHYN